MKWRYLFAVVSLLSMTRVRAADEPAARAVMDEVVVTAERRETNLLETPASLTPLSAGQLADAAVSDIGQAAALVPNLFIDASGYRGAALHSIRGIPATVVSSTPALGYYVDDVPQLRYWTVNTELLDIERIEVLRGPQGTLHGRDAIGGVVNVRTREPTGALHASAGVRLGNYDLREGRFSFATPLADDAVRLSVAGVRSIREGFARNEFLDGRDVDYRDGTAGRAKLHILPAADFTTRLAVWGERDRDGGTHWDFSERVDTQPFRVERDVRGRSDRDIYGASARFDYDPALPFRLTSVTAVQYFDVEIYDDLIDLSAQPVAAGNLREDQTQVTAELRATSPESETPLRWLLGAFYFHEDYDVAADYLFNPLVGVPSRLRQDDAINQGFALFGQATYTLIRTVDATLGLRYEGEWQDVTVAEEIVLPAPVNTREKSDASYGEWLPRFTLAQRWTTEHTTYIAIARGFRAGGYNIFFDTPDTVQFGPESAWSYEIGHKARLFDGAVAVSAAFFFTDYDDQQIQEADLVAVRYRITNAGASTIKGFELEGATGEFHGAALAAGIGAQYGTFDEYDDPVRQQSYAGNYIPLAPQYNFHASLQHRAHLGWEVHSLTRVEGIGTGPMYANASNDARFASYQLLNFHLGLAWRALSVGFFMRNALDAEYIVYGTVGNGSPTGAVQPGDPRTFGVVLGAQL